MKEKKKDDLITIALPHEDGKADATVSFDENGWICGATIYGGRSP